MRRFSRWCVWAGSVLSGVTGIVYWWMKEMMEPVSEWAVINHPLQPWVLKAHIVTAPIVVFAVGLIAVDHVWKQYRLGVRAGRRSGLSAAVMVLPMVLSGYLIQSVTAPAWLEGLAWLHLGTGVVYLAGVGAHQVVVPRRRTRRESREVDLHVVLPGRESTTGPAPRRRRHRKAPSPGQAT